MRKKWMLLLAASLLLTWSVGCAEVPSEGTGSVSNGESTGGGESGTAADVDIDLTTLSSTMVYAEVYNIMTNPDDYIGKTIRMRGPYINSFYDVTGLNYHYVMIKDAAACCQQGIEFKLPEDLAYPQDYPVVDTEIEVAGVFGSYDELDYTYYYLEVDEMSVIEG